MITNVAKSLGLKVFWRPCVDPDWDYNDHTKVARTMIGQHGYKTKNHVFFSFCTLEERFLRHFRELFHTPLLAWKKLSCVKPR